MNVALLGVGHWHGLMHAQAVIAAGAGIAAVWDPDSGTAARLAARLGAVQVHTPQAALAMRPDFCVVMGHPTVVPALARAVIAAGIAMVLEKPAAATTAELRQLQALALGRRAFVAVPLANRMSPAMGPGHGGSDVLHATFRIVNGPPQRYRDMGVPWVLDPAIGGGGALRNLGLHGVDSALCLAQGPLRVLTAHVNRLGHPQEAVEDHAIVVLTDASGALFTVEAGYTAPGMTAGGDYEWRVARRDRTLIDRGDSVICLGADQQTARPPLPLDARYGAFMGDTLARLGDGRPPLVGLADYVAAMALIDDAYAMASA